MKPDEISPIGYVYVIREISSGFPYVGAHRSTSFDRTYFGSPMSMTGLRARYIELWPQSNKVGYSIPSYEAFSERFEMSILEWCESQDELFLRERFWIDELDSYENGLNRSRGAGPGSVYGISYEKYCDACERLTRWKSDGCYNCLHAELRNVAYCDQCEAETSHMGESCVPCSLKAVTALVYCVTCDLETKHRSGVCQRCVVHRTLKEDECSIHGLTLFSGESCRKCITGLSSKLFCESCGEITSHMFGSCRTCSARNSIELKECPVHGETMHKGDSCFTCVSQKTQSKRFCEVCQEVKGHRGDSCMGCSFRKSIVLSFCVGCDSETNHQKGVCMGCRQRHRKHIDGTDQSCSLCLSDGVLRI